MEEVTRKPRWLEWVVCPRCLGPLDFHEDLGELWCLTDRLVFPIREGIPVLLLDEARALSDPRPPVSSDPPP